MIVTLSCRAAVSIGGIPKLAMLTHLVLHNIEARIEASCCFTERASGLL